MIELEVISEQLGKKRGHLISQDIVDELNRLSMDPDYGEYYVEKYINFFNVLEKNNQWNTEKYANALKFFTLVEANNRLVDAYVKVFPDRLASRLARGESKNDMGGEASRYNASELVNEIRKVAVVPVQLIHRHLLHAAIMKSAQLMNNSDVSYAVQQKAAETLIRELKPAEDSNINIKVGLDEESRSQQTQLVSHIGQIALNQQKMLAAGMSIEEIQKLNITINRADDYEEAEYE